MTVWKRAIHGANLVMRAVAGLLLLTLAACSGEQQNGGGSGTPAEFDHQCNASGVTCHGGNAPPSLVGTYTGTGTTLVTSSELWSVGSSEDFRVEISEQNSPTIRGRIEIASMQLTIESAKILGFDESFTIYGTHVTSTEDCDFELRGIISGTFSEASSDNHNLTGKFALEFTNNVQGTGCTEQQKTQYPATGATFDYAATRASGAAG